MEAWSLEAWSRAVVRTLPAPPGVRPGRSAVSPLPAPPQPAPAAPAAPAGPPAGGKRTRRGTDRRRAAKMSRRESEEVVVVDDDEEDDDEEDDRGRSSDGTSTSEPSEPRRRRPRKSNGDFGAVVTVDLTESTPEPAAKTPAPPARRRANNKTILENVARRAKLSRPPPPFVSAYGRTHDVAGEVPFARDVARAKDAPRVKDDEEIAREIDALLDRRKLRLVLDLDHTLLNSATVEDCAADGADALLESRVAAEIQAENARASKGGPRAENPGAETHRSLHRLADSGLWTKTRPGVRTFLRKAACLFEIHICTAGSQAYAERMRALLDPTRELVRGSVVGLATFDRFGVPEPHEVVKTMARELRGSEPIAAVLDDTAAVWPGHAENLIVCERYVYFPSCARKFGSVTPSLLERRVDESADRGMLATVFDVLRRVHADFFARRAAARELRLRTEARGAPRFAADDEDDEDDEDGEDGEDVANREVGPSRSQSVKKTKRSDVSVSVPVTVPELLTLEKRRVLRGAELVFSGVVPSGADPSAHPLWRLAEAFGARCVRAPDDAATTHVVVEPANLGPGGTDKMIWATRLGKHVVTPGWVLTSAASFQRADETAFAVRR